MKLHQHGFSPVALDKMVTVNAQVKSGGVAVEVLKKVTSICVCESQLNHLTETIGAELAATRDAQAAEQVAGTLPAAVEQAPQVVAVGTDGGRIFTRAEEAGRGVHEPAWKETKIACLSTLHSAVFDADPHPELPRCFADQAGVDKLVREIKSLRNAARDSADDSPNEDARDASPADKNLWESLVLPPESAVDAPHEEADDAAEAACPDKPKLKPKRPEWRPRRLVRTCVASMCNSDDFGPQVAAEARRRNFFAASRRAFLGDGLPWNWTLWRRHFPDFVPIVDFVHPMTYLYEASRVVAAAGAEWELCLRWLTAAWQGQVSRVIEELRHWHTLHPAPPGEKLPASDGRRIVSKALGYLSHNVSRMNYPQYRQAGLPVTSSMVESLIKEFNYRVKGSEKSWKRPSGCEAILQVRGAVLCDDRDRLSEFILSRPGSAFYRPSTNNRASAQNSIAA